MSPETFHQDQPCTAGAPGPDRNVRPSREAGGDRVNPMARRVGPRRFPCAEELRHHCTTIAPLLRLERRRTRFLPCARAS
jgi:hypothetical protein